MESKNTALEQNLNDQEQRRREKLPLYREKGIDPFGQKFPIDATSAGLREKFSSLQPEEVREEEKVSIAGRIVLLRKMATSTSSRPSARCRTSSTA